MAGYFLLVKTFSRAKGNSATKAAAYPSGERIRDERSGAVHDYPDRTDVAHAKIVPPEMNRAQRIALVRRFCNNDGGDFKGNSHRRENDLTL